MKLAEALIERADTQKRIAQLRERLSQNARVQEGEAVSEQPGDLMLEHARAIAAWLSLVQRINRTNAAARLVADDPADTRTLSDAIAERDALRMRITGVEHLIAASAPPDVRYGRAEIRYLRTVDVRALRAELDGLSRALRELDTMIQARNWAVDLA
jgi:hypothetical protein